MEVDTWISLDELFNYFKIKMESKSVKHPRPIDNQHWTWLAPARTYFRFSSTDQNLIHISFGFPIYPWFVCNVFPEHCWYDMIWTRSDNDLDQISSWSGFLFFSKWTDYQKWIIYFYLFLLMIMYLGKIIYSINS